MKTSDKLLLTLALLILGTFGAVQLTLYARLKAGHITNEQSREEWTRCYKGAAPSRIILKGNINITLRSSDSTVVDVEKDAEEKIRCRMAGDSLVIRGDSFLTIDPHSMFQNYTDLPWVSLDVAPGTLISVEGQLAILQSSKLPGRPSMNIKAVNSQVWVGESYATNGVYYDSLHIEEVNSALDIQSNAAVMHLSARLDDKSTLNEVNHSIGTIDLQYTPQSRIGLKGATLDQLKQLPCK